ncbi:MAG: penicillin-binding protein 2 [Phycisphaeraceae bacterium]
MRVARFTTVLITIALVTLIARVVYLQTRAPTQVQALVDTQFSTAPLHAERGPIFDRLGRVMASSDTIRRLYIDATMVTDPADFALKLGQALGYDPAVIQHMIQQRPTSRYLVVDKQLSDARYESVKRLRLPGLATETRYQRHYPMGSAAGQVIGFVGADNVGLENVEKVFNAPLAGTPGRMVYLRDASRRPIWIDAASFTHPTDGQAVRLSIDITIQTIVEAELRKAAEQYGAKSAQMIVMDPYTGEVLAMANYPSFDPNELAHSTGDLRRNRCLTDQFEPGSIFKPFVWAAATQTNIARPSEMIDCTGGLWVTAAGRRLHDAHGNGMQTWEGVLIKSSNIGMGKIGQRMGNQSVYRAVRAFGFGEPTSINLEGEMAGTVNPLSRWSGYSVTSLPMGQEIAVTPLQITRGFCTFANGGYLIRPTILAVDDVRQQGGRQIIGRVLTPGVSDLTRHVLRRAVSEGTGRKADSSFYTIWGKTGTAQVPGPHGGYLPGGYVGSFVAGAPLDRPRIVVGCFIHRPDPSKGYYGGIVAAPPVKAVIEQTLQYMGVAPDKLPDNHEPILARNIDARE